jgi:hypothetical protein
VDYISALHAAFSDELVKIAAVRMGSMPFKPGTLASAKKLTKKGVLTKISMKLPKIPALKKGHGYAAAAAGGAVVGGVAVHKGKQVADDYRTGRAMRHAREGR